MQLNNEDNFFFPYLSFSCFKRKEKLRTLKFNMLRNILQKFMKSFVNTLIKIPLLPIWNFGGTEIHSNFRNLEVFSFQYLLKLVCHVENLKSWYMKRPKLHIRGLSIPWIFLKIRMDSLHICIFFWKIKVWLLVLFISKLLAILKPWIFFSNFYFYLNI